MSELPFDVSPQVLAAAAFTKRWGGMAAADVDLATVATWDRHLVRDRRVLVPVDVQALVVPAVDGEATVAVGGIPGDPDPFDAGAVPQAGVHLHWAMPDALLRGGTAEATGELAMPALPDRWAVIRHLYPVGSRSVHITGWVVDAVTATVTSLLDFHGQAFSADAASTFLPLDGMRGGSPLWTATYAAARGRFTLHDPLTDLPGLAAAAPNGWDGGRAAYTVAGWWTSSGEDPLAGAIGADGLQAALASLGWWLTPDGEDLWDVPPDPRTSTLKRRMGLTSGGGATPMTTVGKYAQEQTTAEDVIPYAGLPVSDVGEVVLGVASTRYHSLLHGSVLGVPVDGTANGADDRPSPDALRGGALGLDLDDVAAALAAPGLGLGADRRQLAERLMAAFTSGRLATLGTADGLADLEEGEHGDAFWSLSGPALPTSHDDVVRAEDSAPFGPTRLGRKGRGALATSSIAEVSIAWTEGVSFRAAKAQGVAKALAVNSVEQATQSRRSTPKPPVGSTSPSAGPTGRTVPKPPPRRYRPAPIVAGIRGIRPHNRHHGDGLFEGGVLRCRYPGEALTTLAGVVDGGTLVPTLGSGAIPPEVTLVVREATLLDGYHHGWLAAAGATPGRDVDAVHNRVVAELTRVHGTTATYDGTGVGALREIADRSKALGGSPWQSVRESDQVVAISAAAELAAYSGFDGTPPSPIAITTWRQPWVPLFLEWEVRVDGSGDLDGWTLAGTDLAGAPVASPLSQAFVGRSPLHRGVGEALTNGIRQWLAAEQARDAADPSTSQLDDADEAALAALADTLAPLDLASASLDGLREQLLGIRYSGLVVRDPNTTLPVADGVPLPLFGGTASVTRLRIVDAFGRTLTVPADGLVTTAPLDTGIGGQVRLAPRIQNAARWLFRLIDPALALTADPATAQEAWVDQIHPDVAVNPVCGFLLPDHIDEALEVFDRTGEPLGQLMHDTVTDAVMWEPAPGRPVPPDAGPMTDLPVHAQHVGLLATGVVRADIDARHRGAVTAESSALTALLRAVDSTLWSVDTYAALGSPTVAGLVGRPIAVVRATLRLDAPDDVAEVTVAAAGGVDARRAAYAALDDLRFPVRVGELGRADDSVLGFFVDDDYTRFHVVDKVVASLALDTGRHRGQLGLLGAVEVPPVRPLDHPFLDLEDTVLVRLGQTMRLTILMLPAGKVHLTSGILPRKHLALADDWVTPGLKRLIPSMRVGPVLVDPAQIRLPKVAAFGANQQFTRRTGPLTWRDDPIVAASTAAYLPPMPHEAQDGWVRIAPAPPADGSTSGGSG